MAKRETVLNHPERETREMALPEGKSCDDCQEFPRCKALIALEPENEVCDFWPNRFLDITSRFMNA